MYICLNKSESYTNHDISDHSKIIVFEEARPILLDQLCDDHYRLTEENECEECEDYTKVSGDGKSCVHPMCAMNHVMSKDGSCFDCPAYQIPGPDQKVCD